MYYNAGADLIVADITDPSAPSTLGRWTDSDRRSFSNIYVANTLLYVPHGFAGVDIVDISNANQPVKLGNIPIRYLGPTPAIHDIEVSGVYAYVPQGKWFRVVDVTIPTLPTDIAVITPTTSYLGSIAMSGNYVYITAGSTGLIVIDISTPISPTVVGALDTPGYAQGIVKRGNYVYISESDAIRIIDVSNPSNPVQVGVYQPSQFYPRENIAVSGNLLYLQNAYGDELHIVNISNPSTPSQAGVLSLPSSGDGLYLSGSTVYLGTYRDGLAIVDVSEPGSPSLLNTIGKMVYADSIADADGDVFVTSQQDLWYLRPQASSVAATLVWSTPLYLGEMAVRDELAYLTKNENMYGTGYLEILDVSNPYSPVSLGTASLTIQGASSIAISGTYAYVGSWGGISAINIANPNSPYETSSVPVPSGVNVRGVDIEGNHLYAATTAGLKIYNISDLATLNFVGEYTGVSASDVVVKGRYAYLTLNSAQQLQIIDVLTLSAPTLVRTLSTCGVSSSVTLSNGYAYVTDGCRQIALYDISNPLSGTSYSIASAGLPSFGQQVVVEGDEISVAAGSGGFVKLQRLDSVSDYIPTSGGGLTSPDGDVTIRHYRK